MKNTNTLNSERKQVMNYIEKQFGNANLSYLKANKKMDLANNFNTKNVEKFIKEAKRLSNKNIIRDSNLNKLKISDKQKKEIENYRKHVKNIKFSNNYIHKENQKSLKEVLKNKDILEVMKRLSKV